jgi:hypothetical protein
LHAPAAERLVAQVRRLADHCPVLMLQGTFSHEPPGTLAIFKLLGGGIRCMWPSVSSKSHSLPRDNGLLRRAGASTNCRPVLVPCSPACRRTRRWWPQRSVRRMRHRPWASIWPSCCAVLRRSIGRRGCRACPPSACRTARYSAA